MSQNPHPGDTFNLLQWQILASTKLFCFIYWGHSRISNCNFSQWQCRSVKISQRKTDKQTEQKLGSLNSHEAKVLHRTKGNGAAVESSGQCSDNEANTEVATKYQAKTQGEPSGSYNANTCSSDTRFSWLYTNPAFNIALLQRGTFYSKTSHRNFSIAVGI